MNLKRLIRRIANIRIAGFRIKLGYRKKPLHEDMYEQKKKARDGQILTNNNKNQ